MTAAQLGHRGLLTGILLMVVDDKSQWQLYQNFIPIYIRRKLHQFKAIVKLFRH